MSQGKEVSEWLSYNSQLPNNGIRSSVPRSGTRAWACEQVDRRIDGMEVIGTKKIEVIDIPGSGDDPLTPVSCDQS